MQLPYLNDVLNHSKLRPELIPYNFLDNYSYDDIAKRIVVYFSLPSVFESISNLSKPLKDDALYKFDTKMRKENGGKRIDYKLLIKKIFNNINYRNDPELIID